MERVQAGQDWKPLKASDQNAIFEATEYYQNNISMGVARGGNRDISDSNKLWLRNDTGSDLAQGHVLEIGASLLTTLDPDNPWFAGETPDPDGTKGIAVALFPTPEDALYQFQAAGLVRAKVNIVHEQQTRCDVSASSTLLQSKWYGRGEIVSKESSGTGEKWCWVRLGEMFRGPIEGVVTESGGIAMNTIGEVTVYLNGSAVTGGEIPEVYYTWLYNADLAEGQRVTFEWYPDRQKFVIRTPWC